MRAGLAQLGERQTCGLHEIVDGSTWSGPDLDQAFY